MLEITIKGRELFDSKTSTFYTLKDQTLQLEHSLLSISKWESITHKPFLGKEHRSSSDISLYIRCMTLNKGVDPQAYNNITSKDLKKILAYIDDPATATWFGKEENQRRGSRKPITSELIYYWMIAGNVPMQCEKWHLNRLLTLLHIVEIKNRPKKKGQRMSASQMASLNAKRLAANGGRG